MRNELIKIRATQDEKEAFETASSLAGLSLSAWMRERLRRTVIRELTEAGIKISFLQSSQGQEECRLRVSESMLRMQGLVPSSIKTYSWCRPIKDRMHGRNHMFRRCLKTSRWPFQIAIRPDRKSTRLNSSHLGIS